MGSVIAIWRGQCDTDRQNEFLPRMARLAETNLQYKASFPTPLNPLSRKIKEHRSGGRPALPPTRTFDEVVAGKVLLRTDIFESRKSGIDAAAGCGAEILPGAEGDGHDYLQVADMGIRGLDFALFDAYGRYPGSDRLSFVFLQCPDLPTLDGRLVHVHDSEVCAAYTNPHIRTADWLLECPFIHLRYTLEEWLDQLLSWTRFFFIPDLYYWRYDDMPSCEKWSAAFDQACRASGRAEAIGTTFDDLIAAYRRETGQSVFESQWQ